MSDKGGVGYGSIPDAEDSTPASAAAAPPQRSEICKFVAEVIGTCTLVQIGCGGICSNVYLGEGYGIWQIAALWILGATVGVYASAPLSGGHLNPAVTLSFAIVRPSDFSWKDLPLYWAAQIVGGIIAGLVNMMIYCSAIKYYEGENDILRGEDDGIRSAVGFGDYWSLSPGVANPFHAFVIEAVGTAFLLFVIFAVTHPKNNVPPPAVAPLVGVAIGCMIALLGPLTGAGINPARDMGPRLVTRWFGWGRAAMTGWWPYLVGPLVGGPIGAAVADFLLFQF